MKLKALTLGQVAGLAGVNYYAASRIIRGRERNDKMLAKLERTVAKQKTPQDAAV